MKRRCREIDITKPETIRPFIWECIKRHYKRHDFRDLLIKFGLTRKEYQYVKESKDYMPFMKPVDNLSRYCAECIKNRGIELQPAKLSERLDKTTGKVRLITCETPMQQIFEFIAVNAAMPIFRARLVYEQAAGLKGRGQIYGVRLIKRIIQKDNAAVEYAKRHGKRASYKTKHFVKHDIRQCFPSMRKNVFMRHFRRDCNNDDLVWLFDTLLNYHKVDGYEGFLIGSFISQWASQYLISWVYRYVVNLRDSRGRRLVFRCIVWMDDILMIGPNERNLEKASVLMIAYTEKELGLQIKPDWNIETLEGKTPIDMMGFTIYRSGKVSIRGRNFIKARRIVLRTALGMSLRQAKRLLSFKGFFDHSNCYKARIKYNFEQAFKKAASIISKDERAKNGKRILNYTTGGFRVQAASG